MPASLSEECERRGGIQVEPQGRHTWFWCLACLVVVTHWPWAWIVLLADHPYPVENSACSSYLRVLTCCLPHHVCLAYFVMIEAYGPQPSYRDGMWLCLAGSWALALNSISCLPLRSRSGAMLSGLMIMSYRSCGHVQPQAPSLSTSALRAPRSSTSSYRSEA